VIDEGPYDPELNTIARDLLAECEDLNEVWISWEVSNL
jgi:hypothetical protein